MNSLLYFFGYRQIRVPECAVTAFFNLCMQEQINPSVQRREGAEGLCVRCALWEAHRLLLRCDREGIPYEIERTAGLLPRLGTCRHRIGLLIGVAFAAVLLFLSGRFVWALEISGNERMSEAEVLAVLREEGLQVGSYIPRLHMGEVENRVLIRSDEISWISIHMDGTVAIVQIIEQQPIKEPVSAPANLIARTDGQIELIELYRGNCVVSIGQAVRKGQLLAGGVWDSQTVGMRFTRAAGRVLARTEETFSMEIPFQYEKKVYTKRRVEEIVLNFFGFSVKIFKNSRNSTVECDIIKREINCNTSKGRVLPISLTVQYRMEFETEEHTRTVEEAQTLAYAALSRRLAQLSEQAELLSKEVTLVQTESALIIDCRMQCIEDIAVQSEFDVVIEP